MPHCQWCTEMVPGHWPGHGPGPGLSSINLKFQLRLSLRVALCTLSSSWRLPLPVGATDSEAKLTGPGLSESGCGAPEARDGAIQTFAYLYLPTAKSEDSSIAERAREVRGRPPTAAGPGPPGERKLALAVLERRDEHVTAEIGRAAVGRSLRLGGLHVRGRRGGG